MCTESGFKITHVPPNDSDAFRKVVEVMTEAEKQDQRVVIHCASGQKRTGDVLALWLHRRYCIPVEIAVKEITDFAKGHRLLRRPSASGVLSLLAPKTLSSTPPMPPSWSVSPTKHTPRQIVTSSSSSSSSTETKSFHVTVFQMGGEIDKHYENSKVSFGEPSTLRIFQDLPFVGFTYDVRTVCRKDGSSVTSSDRDRLADACTKVKSNKILITHGIKGAIETALVLRRVEALGSKTILVTGSRVPDCMKGTDATFNIGVAVGALNVLRRGVFVSMNGRIFESSKCKLDENSRSIISTSTSTRK